jgi:hypothetical protein
MDMVREVAARIRMLRAVALPELTKLYKSLFLFFFLLFEFEYFGV